MTDLDSILDRIKLWAGRHGRKKLLSRETGIHVVALSKMHSPDWNPTAATIRKLDAAVTKLQADTPDTSQTRV